MNPVESPIIKLFYASKDTKRPSNFKKAVSAREFLRQEVGKKTRTKKLHLINSINPREPFTNSMRWARKLEGVALPESMIPVTLQNFVDEAIIFFQRVATQEGLVDPHTNLKFRVKFIPKEAWDEVDEKDIGGYLDCRTNTCFVKLSGYSNPNSQELLDAALTAFHEMRHRVNNRVAEYYFHQGSMFGSGKLKEKRVSSNLSYFSTRDNSYIFEEMYTVGFIAKHFERFLIKLGDESLLDAWQERKLKAEKDNFDFDDEHIHGEETLMMVNSQRTLHEGRHMGRYFLKTYFYLESVIPNFEQHLISIRRGDKLSKNRLAKAIIGSIGKEGLVKLLNIESLFELKQFIQETMGEDQDK